MTSFAAKLVSNQPCFYSDIFFASRMRVSWKNVLFALSVLIGWSLLHLLATGDVSVSWLAARTLRTWLASADFRVSASDTISRLKLKLRQTSLLRCNIPRDRFISVQTGLKRESNSKRVPRSCFTMTLILQLMLASSLVNWSYLLQLYSMSHG